MRRRFTRNAVLLPALVIGSYAVGWLCHGLSQSQLYQREMESGSRLRSDLSSQLNQIDELACCKISRTLHVGNSPSTARELKTPRKH